VIRFIDWHRDRRTAGLRWGVEPICETLQFAPQTYYAARHRRPSARRQRDEELKVEVRRVWEDNYRVYGAPKIWSQLNREGIRVARCTVERLMADMRIRGVIRGHKPITTRSGATEAEARPPDLLDRDFGASAPNEKWVADLTYVRCRSGFCYVAFIIDCYARMIVGWWVAKSMRTDLVLDALEHAIWARGIGPGSRPGPIHHSDAGSQYLSIRYSERLLAAGVEPSVGSIGDSYDNALAESIIGLYKTELVYNLGPFDELDDLEWATFEYVDWFNHRRLMGNTPPVEREEHYYLQDSHTTTQPPKS
jgi:transposase InsO family protein